MKAFKFLTVAIICLFTCQGKLLAASPPLTESAQKESSADSEVVKEDIDRMKEDVINKKAQMLIFQQLVKSEGIESTYPIVTITHVNEMSSRYKIVSLTYTVDKDRTYTYQAEENKGKAALGREVQVFKGPLVAGTHDLDVEVVYQGNDTGFFSYINAYRVPVQLKKSIRIEKGQNLDVQVVGFEKGWAFSDFNKRPDLKIKLNGSTQAKRLK